MPSKNLGRVSIVPKGTWNANTVYNRLDAVAHNGSSWLAKKQNTGQMPAEGSDAWQLLAERGADGYTPVRGVDYWTEADIASIRSYVDDAILAKLQALHEEEQAKAT